MAPRMVEPNAAWVREVTPALRAERLRIGDHDAVAPAFLRDVEPPVGDLQQRFVVRGAVGGTDRHADRHRERNRFRMRRARGPGEMLRVHLDRESHALGHGAGGREIGARQQRREFLAAETRGHVHAAQVRAQDLREQREHGVAGCVAVAVVHALEIVDVEHQHGERGAIGRGACIRHVRVLRVTRVVGALRAFDGFGKRLLKAAAIREARERVAARERFEPSARLHIIAEDILDDKKRADEQQDQHGPRGDQRAAEYAARGGEREFAVVGGGHQHPVRLADALIQQVIAAPLDIARATLHPAPGGVARDLQQREAETTRAFLGEHAIAKVDHVAVIVQEAEFNRRRVFQYVAGVGRRQLQREQTRLRDVHDHRAAKTVVQINGRTERGDGLAFLQARIDRRPEHVARWIAVGKLAAIVVHAAEATQQRGHAHAVLLGRDHEDAVRRDEGDGALHGVGVLADVHERTDRAGERDVAGQVDVVAMKTGQPRERRGVGAEHGRTVHFAGRLPGDLRAGLQRALHGGVEHAAARLGRGGEHVFGVITQEGQAAALGFDQRVDAHGAHLQIAQTALQVVARHVVELAQADERDEQHRHAKAERDHEMRPLHDHAGENAHRRAVRGVLRAALHRARPLRRCACLRECAASSIASGRGAGLVRDVAERARLDGFSRVRRAAPARRTAEASPRYRLRASRARASRSCARRSRRDSARP
ncbi:hypothetical protein PT2222_80261 [Paraburkholderia tropica]